MEETKIKEDVIVEETINSTVSEGCDCKEKCAVKKEHEDDEDEKNVAVKEGVQAEHKANQAKEVSKEKEKDLMEQLLDIASVKVAKIVEAAISEAPITEEMSEEEVERVHEGIMEDGKRLLSNVMSVLEEIIAGSALDLNGHQATIIDFVGKGGTVNASLPAGINPPVKHETNEHEQKVHIKEEVDYKSLYAESEAVMNELVEMVEQTSEKYKTLVECYNTVSNELNAYKLVESYGITVAEGLELLADYEYNAIVEEFDRQIAESNEEKSEDKEEKKEDKEEKKEDKEEPEAKVEEIEAAEIEEEKSEEKEEPKAEEKAEDKEEKEEEKSEDKEEKEEEKSEDKPEVKAEEIKAELDEIEECSDKDKEKDEKTEEIKESLKVEGEVISESKSVSPIRKAFSVFSSGIISENKKSRKAFSVFAD